MNDICQICGGVRGHHFAYCDRESRMSPEERALIERLAGNYREEHLHPRQHPEEAATSAARDSQLRLSLSLEQAFQVVDGGGKLTIVGSGPLSDPTAHPYSATLTSHTGARGASGTGKTLAACLHVLVEQWRKL